MRWTQGVSCARRVSFVPRPEGLTENRLLGGKVLLRQPGKGNRAAIDAVLLAAAVSATAGDRFLELGCGVGPASLCLAARFPGCRILGIDTASDLVALANENATLNQVDEHVRFEVGDVVELARGGTREFDGVFANPPYLMPGRDRIPANPARADAFMEGRADLSMWVNAGKAALRDGGTITFVHRADRLDELVSVLRADFGAIGVLPIRPAADRAATRVIVAAKKGRKTALNLAPDLILHGSGAQYAADAQAILNGVQGLDPWGGGS